MTTIDELVEGLSIATADLDAMRHTMTLSDDVPEPLRRDAQAYLDAAKDHMRAAQTDIRNAVIEIEAYQAGGKS